MQECAWALEPPLAVSIRGKMRGATERQGDMHLPQYHPPLSIG